MSNSTSGNDYGKVFRGIVIGCLAGLAIWIVLLTILSYLRG